MKDSGKSEHKLICFEWMFLDWESNRVAVQCKTAVGDPRGISLERRTAAHRMEQVSEAAQ